MSKSTTRMTSFRRLEGKGDLGPTLILLMLACNDLTLGNDALAAWHSEQTASRKQREIGAKMYFVRLQVAHIYEALSIVEHIQLTPKLSEAVAACDAQTRESFNKVCAILGTEDYRSMARIRNNLAFHYDQKVVQRALTAAADAHPNLSWVMSLGQDPLDWFFEPADRIVDRIVVRDILGVSQNADVRVEVDKIVVRLQKTVEAFVDFAGYFIWHHTARS